jgi:hypothetical protein
MIAATDPSQPHGPAATTAAAAAWLRASAARPMGLDFPADASGDRMTKARRKSKHEDRLATQVEEDAALCQHELDARRENEMRARAKADKERGR